VIKCAGDVSKDLNIFERFTSVFERFYTVFEYFHIVFGRFYTVFERFFLAYIAQTLQINLPTPIFTPKINTPTLKKLKKSQFFQNSG
jgi:hypothetical protein